MRGSRTSTGLPIPGPLRCPPLQRTGADRRWLAELLSARARSPTGKSGLSRTTSSACHGGRSTRAAACRISTRRRQSSTLMDAGLALGDPATAVGAVHGPDPALTWIPTVQLPSARCLAVRDCTGSSSARCPPLGRQQKSSRSGRGLPHHRLHPAPARSRLLRSTRRRQPRHRPPDQVELVFTGRPVRRGRRPAIPGLHGQGRHPPGPAAGGPTGSTGQRRRRSLAGKTPCPMRGALRELISLCGAAPRSSLREPRHLPSMHKGGCQ
jgi:hypothetical protein